MNRDLDWDDVARLLNELIQKKTTIAEGIEYLSEQLSAKKSKSVFELVNTQRLEKEFSEWVSAIFLNENMPEHINSIYFGICTMCDPAFNKGKDTTAIYFAGLSANPEKDEDWACWDTDSFLPEEKYKVLTDFCLLDELVQKADLDPNIEILVYNGLLILLIVNNITNNNEQLFSYNTDLPNEEKREILYVGAGHDSGDVFVIGKLTKEGLLY